MSSNVFTTNPHLKKLGKFDLLKVVERLEAIELVAENTSGSVVNMAQYADVARVQGATETIHEYVELDTTFFNDCRHLPPTATVILAVQRTFGEDDDRRIIYPPKGNDGVWKVETSNMEMYRKHKELLLNEERIARVSIRNEKITILENGKVQRRNVRNANDLLITLRYADSFPLSKIKDEDIIQAIVDLDIGSIKRAPQKQFDRSTGEFTGNKYFVLEGVSPEDRSKIPNEFAFNVEGLGKLLMSLSHRHQLRFCGFCGKKHDAVCAVRQKVDEMKKERDALKEEKNFSLRICGDSTIRYANEAAVAGNVEAMSGATTGNILNSLEVDDHESEQIVFITGSNEKKSSNVTTPEYLYTLKKIKERVLNLLENNKKVAIVPPPKPVVFLDAEVEVRDEFYRNHLTELANNGVMVWENPIEHYEEDWGEHPSPDQTAELWKYVAEKVKAELGLDMLLKSATDDVIALPNKYWHVQSFYKYGCGACNSKEKNKWFSICDICKEAAKNDEVVKKQEEEYASRLEEIFNEENPSLEVESEGDELKCDTCNVVFTEITDLRKHFKESHPETTMKFKRSRQNKDDGETKGRRVKKNPTKSL